jgi:chromate transporter
MPDTNAGSITNPITDTKPERDSGLAPGDSAKPPRLGPLQLFISFSLLTMSGFGGVLPFAYRMLVEKKRWMNKAEFAELFALSQMLPGPPIIHMAQVFGHRDSGWRGGAAAVAGLVALPTVFMMLLGLAYEQFGEVQAFRKALTGMSAAAVALIIVMAIRISSAVPRRTRPWLVVTAAFVCLGVARLPFISVILLLTPLSVWLAWTDRR